MKNRLAFLHSQRLPLSKRLVGPFFFTHIFLGLLATRLEAIETEISLNVQQVPIVLLLKCLAQLEGKSFLDLETASQSIGLSAWLVQKPWRPVVVRCLARRQLQLNESEEIWSLEKQQDSPVKAVDSQERTSPISEQKLQWHYFPLQHLDVTAVGKLLSEQRGILSPSGSVHLLKPTNTVLLKERPDYVEAFRTLLSKLDVPTPQIQIEARIVSASEEALEELGIRWKFNASNSAPAGALANLELQKGNLSAGCTLPFSPASLDLELAALQSENRLTIVAAPTLRTTARTTASIKQGTEMPYRSFRTQDGSGQEPITILFKEAVLSLEVTPRLLFKERLMLAVQLTHNTPGHNLSSEEELGHSINKQEIRTEVEVNSGETIVLGGIFQGSTDRQRKGIPFLGELPWIGRLFSYQMQTHQQRELLVFLTPRLMEQKP